MILRRFAIRAGALCAAIAVLSGAAAADDAAGEDGQAALAASVPQATNVLDMLAALPEAISPPQYRWPPNTAILVCWRNPAGFDVEREWVRQAVARTWQAYADINLTGWGPCAGRRAHVEILIADEQPVAHVGTSYMAAQPRMTLNFTFGQWGTQSCQDARQQCIEAIAVHEFGHALGLEHEQLHDDVSEECRAFLGSEHFEQEWARLRVPLRALTEYDPNSIMNYCNNIYGRPAQLSALDVIGIQLLFPSATGRY